MSASDPKRTLGQACPVLTALRHALPCGARKMVFGGGNVGKRYYRFLVHCREYLHISDSFSTPRGGGSKRHPFPIVSIQCPRDYARNEQRSVRHQANQACLHVAGHRASGIEVRTATQCARTISVEEFRFG